MTWFSFDRLAEFTPIQIEALRQAQIQAWIDRLNWLGAHAAEREQRRVECALLGHTPSGERFLTAHPINVCWWCADEFYDPPLIRDEYWAVNTR